MSRFNPVALPCVRTQIQSGCVVLSPHFSQMLQMGGYPMPMPPKTTAIAALTPGMPKVQVLHI